MAGQVSEDYLAEVRWVPLDQILNYDVIKNMHPVLDAMFAVLGASGARSPRTPVA